jgi:sialic acid synthase SpsE
LGAKLIEKHLTLDRSLAGPDHQASLEPSELKQLFHAIRNTERALGSSEKRPTERELETAAVARKSLVATRDLAAGTRLDATCLRALRPGTGIRPDNLPWVLGRRLNRHIQKGEPLRVSDLGDDFGIDDNPPCEEDFR